MKNRLLSFTALGFLLAALFVAALPAWAADVDKRIQALEDELMRLKSEQTQVKQEQIEMRKEARAAEAALPTFTYRPGSGLNIEAADKAWSINMAVDAHYRMNFTHGRDDVGRTQGEVMGRRFRLQHTYCVNNCFWEISLRLDLDGFGTNSALQRGAGFLHLEQVSPWLPTVYFGMDIPASLGEYREGGPGRPTAEFDLLTRGYFNTGSSSQGVGLNWDDKDLSWLGIPGRMKRFNFAMAATDEAGDGRSSSTDRKDFVAYISIEPFSKLESKWLKGWGFDVGTHWCNNDPRAPENACDELRIRDSGDGGRQNMFRTAEDSFGRGMVSLIAAGAQWQVGPYTLTGTGAWFRVHNSHSAWIERPFAPDDEDFQNQSAKAGNTGGVKANMWRIQNQLYLWSPKGFFTGNDRTAGSILLGQSFERTSVGCGNKYCESRGNIGRNRVLVREWDIWYFIYPRASIGLNFLWYDAANLPGTQESKNLSCKAFTKFAGRTQKTAGEGCEWLDIMLNFRWSF